ncbi:hypothetical protein DPMN_138636 [Dreissena polymorpha]|uniref:Uncharacterized protein n=1 Tax=Dreissena polymorpha TaxID=45954 RepID=A0A9D4JEW1_DREPO|nr:hypothetical protein DPMN_138636 [Dreissena polymorpha]
MYTTKDENPYGWGALGPTVFKRGRDTGSVNPNHRNISKDSGVSVTRNTDIRSSRTPAGHDTSREAEIEPATRFDKNIGSTVAKQIYSSNDTSLLQLGIGVNRNEVIANKRNDSSAERNYAHRHDKRYQQSIDPRTTLNAHPLSSEPEVHERGLQATYRSVTAVSVDTFDDPSRPRWRTLMTTPEFINGYSNSLITYVPKVVHSKLMSDSHVLNLLNNVPP